MKFLLPSLDSKAEPDDVLTNSDYTKGGRVEPNLQVWDDPGIRVAQHGEQRSWMQAVSL